MSDASDMLSRFVTVYGEPRTDDSEKFFAEYAKALKGFSNEILERAAARVLRTHTYPTFPTLGDIIRACRTAAYELDPPRVSEPPPSAAKIPPDPTLVKLVRQSVAATLSAGNSFEDIMRRMPVGGSVDLSAPWGQEVRDPDGNIVPIRDCFASAE